MGEDSKHHTYRCPFNYIGSKSRLLPTLLPFFKRANKDRVLVDLFAGGFSVGVTAPNSEVVYNDINHDLKCLIELIYSMRFEEFNGLLLEKIDHYDLSKSNSDAFYRLRDDFNRRRDSILFCLLIFYSFNHQIRYNQKGKFNTPFGKNRSSYNASICNKLETFSNLLRRKRVEFSSLDYAEMTIAPNSIVYADPPYVLSTGSYNDGKRGVSSWDESHELKLYEYLDSLNEQSIPFVLSNMLRQGSRNNQLLDAWQKKYTMTRVDSSYRNYQRKDYSTLEVIVTNMRDEL